MKIENVDVWNEMTKDMSVKRVRFLNQWASMMELSLLEGKSVSESAKECFIKIRETLPSGFTYKSAAKYLIPTWAYGKDLKKWADNDYQSTGENAKSQVFISDHASKRMRERLGLKKKCHLSVAKKAYYEGYKEEDIKGVFKNYIAHIAEKSVTEDGNNVFVRLYHDNIFVFKTVAENEDSVILVTVYHISPDAKRLKEISRHDQNKIHKKISANSLFSMAV